MRPDASIETLLPALFKALGSRSVETKQQLTLLM
jgi:hypothetical protein